MPFDATPQRPTVTILPPTPTGGGPQQIRIVVELVDRRAPPKPQIWPWLLLFVALALAAHAQPSSWQSWDQGHTRYYEGSDGRRGSTYELSGTRHYEFTSPGGETRHCRSWRQGFTTYTDCD